MSGECGSRTNLEMPDVQRELLAELLKTGKSVVLLNFAGRPTVLTWEKAHVPAIMNVWFGGSEMGDALCDVIFGDKSPSGKLTTSMPKTTGQEPLYYNHQNTGRPVADDNEKFAKFASNCLDVSNGPLYPFGYGLSYTNFSYSNFRLSSQEPASAMRRLPNGRMARRLQLASPLRTTAPAMPTRLCSSTSVTW